LQGADLFGEDWACGSRRWVARDAGMNIITDTSMII
jgi:hypothetical protein